MKIRSSHVVVFVFCVIGLVILLAVVRQDRLPTEALVSGNKTDQFLAEVQHERELGKGSSVKEGIVPSKELALKDHAKLVLQSDLVDMGTIPRTDKSIKRVPVKNGGGSPLEITSIQTTCGCTLGDFEEKIVLADGRKITVIEPNETLDMLVTVDPALILGFHSNKQLTIHSNDPLVPMQPIEVVANVDPEYTIEPEGIDFGSVVRGTAAEARAIIRQAGDEPVDITGVEMAQAGATGLNQPATPPCTVRLLKRAESEWKTPGKPEWDVIATLSPETPAGDLFQQFFVYSTAKRVPKVEFDIVGNIDSFFTVSPPNLGARNVVQAGSKNVATAHIEAQEPIEITDVLVTGMDLSVDIVPGSQPNIAEINLNVRPDAEPGLKNEKVSFLVKGTNNAIKHSMRVYASVEEPAPTAQ